MSIQKKTLKKDTKIMKQFIIIIIIIIYNYLLFLFIIICFIKFFQKLELVKVKKKEFIDNKKFLIILNIIIIFT